MVVWEGPNDTLAPPFTALGGAAAMRPPPSYAPDGGHEWVKASPWKAAHGAARRFDERF